MPTINVSIPKYLRNQVDDLITQGVVSTFSEAVRNGLSLLIRQEKFKRWDDELWQEYESKLLHRDPRSNFLFSFKFQKQLNQLVKNKEPELRRGVNVALRKRKLTKLEIKNYYLLDFSFKEEDWRILVRKQGQNLIACRIGFAAEFFI